MGLPDRVLQLPKERLLVTVYATDDEAFDIWEKRSVCRLIASCASATTRAHRTLPTTSGRWAIPARAAPAPDLLRPRRSHLGGRPGSPEEDGDRFIGSGTWCSCSSTVRLTAPWSRCPVRPWIPAWVWAYLRHHAGCALQLRNRHLPGADQESGRIVGTTDLSNQSCASSRTTSVPAPSWWQMA